MKNKALVLSIFFLFFTVNMSFAKKSNETDPVLLQTQQELISKVRLLMDKKQYSSIYNLLLPQAHNGNLGSRWFLYVMLGESATQLKTVQGISFLAHKTVDLAYFYQGLLAYSNGNGLLGAKILTYIQTKTPSVYYFIGKMYYTSNHIPEGTAYFSLGADMKEAPYGQYYYGLAQMGAGNFARAIESFKKTMTLTNTDEKNLNIKSQIYLALSYFDNGNYQDAYTNAMQVYKTNPVDLLKTIDPGVILTAMKKNGDAKAFWQTALKQKLPYTIQKDIQAKLNYNKRLTDPSYPPEWMR